MALKTRGSVAETTESSGAGPFTLSGTRLDKYSLLFSEVFANNDFMVVRIQEGDQVTTPKWVIAKVQWTSASNQLAVIEVLRNNTGGTSMPTFDTGTKDVFVVEPLEFFPDLAAGDKHKKMRVNAGEDGMEIVADPDLGVNAADPATKLDGTTAVSQGDQHFNTTVDRPKTRTSRGWRIGGIFQEIALAGQYQTITALVALDAAALFKTGDQAEVMGNAVKGDAGLTRVYEWSATDASADNGVTVLRPTSGDASTGNGRWLLLSASIDYTMTAGDATPSVAHKRILRTAGGTNITDFDDGYEGQELTVIWGGVSTITIEHGANIALANGANATLTAALASLSFIRVGTTWHEVSRRVTGTDGGGGGGGGTHAVCEGRLTLTSGQSVMTSNVLAATTVYFANHNGNNIGLYDGSAWHVVPFSELPLNISALAANTNFDMFVDYNGGTPQLQSTAWTTGTGRATALVLQDGVYVKSGATDQRYVGTIRTTGTIGQCEWSPLPAPALGGSHPKLFVWNMYNRVMSGALCADSTDTYSYNSAAPQPKNDSTNNRISFVVGLDGGLFEAVDNSKSKTNGVLDNTRANSIGYDSTTAATQPQFAGAVQPAQNDGANATLLALAEQGFHYVQSLEAAGGTGIVTFYGDANDPNRFQTGMTFKMEM